MSFSLSNRALLRGMLAGAVVLTGTACSRSDRSESGRDNGAAVLPDTSNNPSTAAESHTPRSGTAPAGDKGAAGYRSMERDTTDVPSQDSDSARVTADTAEVSSVSSDTVTTNSAAAADTTVAGYAEMARDTSAQANADVSAKAGVTVADTGRIRPPEDSTEILGQVTTNSTAEGVSPDSIELVRVRPPEDSTEILGADPAADETADEQVIRPEDRETVAASQAPTDEVGAAAIGGNVTGSEAAALITREGVRCAVVDPENNETVRWDMSSTPVTLNPCGMGSMNLSRIWTEK